MRQRRDPVLSSNTSIRTSDPKLPAEHIALGYKQLLEVERDFRHLKADDLDLRLAFHRLEYRVREAFDLVGTPIPLTMR